jgi:AraC-like DNA-binding protein
MSRLLDLHAEAGRLAKASPEILVHRQVARALEQKLLHAMVHCLADGTPVVGSSGNRRHAATLARLEDVLAANHDRPLYLAEICGSIAVSERTLRLCCQEHLGMGPIQYLWLRRMNFAHRALVRATVRRDRDRNRDRLWFLELDASLSPTGHSSANRRQSSPSAAGSRDTDDDPFALAS